MAVLKRIWNWLNNPPPAPEPTTAELFEAWRSLYDEVRDSERRGLEPCPYVRKAEALAYTEWSNALADRRHP